MGCNKTQGLKIAADNLRGRVYEVNHADLTKDAPTKDQAFHNVKFEVLEVNGRNQLSKNCYSKTRLEKWVRLRMQKIATARLSKLNINDAVTMLMNDVLVDEMSKRCNAIVPLRDVKFSKVKVIRTPKFEMAKLYDAHGEIPASKEGEAREVEEAEEPAAEEKKDE